MEEEGANEGDEDNDGESSTEPRILPPVENIVDERPFAIK